MGSTQNRKKRPLQNPPGYRILCRKSILTRILGYNISEKEILKIKERKHAQKDSE